jgi:hypothetical protein
VKNFLFEQKFVTLWSLQPKQNESPTVLDPERGNY